ncbi:MAG TPA: polyribonucleotide nucleotidyltransferase [Terriglobales bacterium]|nr:polyribonucleotide nucleotidyltransferase [Terriglobales bacterium]
MKPEATTVSVELTGGKRLTIETGKLAKQAGGSAIVRFGENVVLAAATSNPEPRTGIDFFPLTVDYREYTYAGGRIPGGFIKREGRMSEREVLTSRQIDRPIRPMFADGFKCETQVIAFVLSADTDNDPDVSGINAASAALTLSDIPFLGPIGAVRVGLVAGRFVANPTYAEMRDGLLNIMVVGTADAIVMIESGAKEVKEETVVDAIEFGHAEIKKICAAINELRSKAGKAKRQVTPPEFDETFFKGLEAKVGRRLADALDTAKHPKAESYELVRTLEKELVAEVPEDDAASKAKLKEYYEKLRERIFRDQVIDHKRRPDGREFDQIREIWIEVGVLPRAHGSAVFTRGETQALVTTTLGTSDDMQRLEGFEGEAKKRFMLHYNFPPFSVGEVGFMRGAGRREIGHGALAERAISAVLPTLDDWPYAMRVVSDILESNGSSSMATICGASLSLMDAGVPLKAPVAGVAMGLVKEGEKYAVLTDIAGAEDHYGDMDFKVAGTKDGITALQMDIKVAGITSQIMREALAQAQRGRMFILGKMDEVITEARVKVSTYAPRIYTLQIPVDKIRDVIGPGGKMIRSIIEQTGVKIDVEDSGKVNVASNDEVSANKALQIIRDLTASAEVGKTYLGKVSRLADFGAFVEILPGLDGLLHISEVAEHRIKDVRDELKEGDQVLVKVLAVEGNRIKLSRKAILKEQRAKMGGAPLPETADGEGPAPTSSQDQGASHGAPHGAPTAVIEGGADFDADDEPNFNRVDGVVASVEASASRPEGGSRDGRPGGGGDRNRRRRGRGRGPGGGQGGHGGGHSSGGGGGRGRR